MSSAVLRADARRLPLPDASVDLICTSPPFWQLRSYTDGGKHYEGQIGSEPTWQEYIANLLICTREWMRVLKPSGNLFVELGDKYSDRGHGPSRGNGTGRGPQATHLPQTRGPMEKSLLGLPWRYALACMDELGLILRRDIIWAKPNGLPESVTDRCRSSHEYVFHLVKQPRYYAAVDEIREPHVTGARAGLTGGLLGGKWAQERGDGAAVAGVVSLNPLGKLPGSVWSIPSQPLVVPAHLGVDHFAAFPLELPRRIIAGWSPPGICTACGEGRRPVADRITGLRLDGRKRPARDNAANWSESACGDNGWGGNRTWDRGVGATITGYACACPQPDAPTQPAVVADPFGGTGTTALVAAALGRHGLSFDLSADYCRLARWRTADRAEIAKAMQVPKPPVVPDGQEALWV